MTKKSNGHVWIKNIAEGYLIYCGHCGKEEVIRLPMAWAEYSAVTGRFDKAHRGCRLPEGGAVTPTAVHPGAGDAS